MDLNTLGSLNTVQIEGSSLYAMCITVNTHCPNFLGNVSVVSKSVSTYHFNMFTDFEC